MRRDAPLAENEFIEPRRNFSNSSGRICDNMSFENNAIATAKIAPAKRGLFWCVIVTKKIFSTNSLS